MADRVAVMYAGKIVETGTVNDIFLDPQHPYTQGLLASIPKPTEDQDRLSVISGTVPDATRFPEGCRFAPRCPSADTVCDQEPSLLSVKGEHSAACWMAEGYPNAPNSDSVSAVGR